MTLNSDFYSIYSKSSSFLLIISLFFLSNTPSLAQKQDYLFRVQADLQWAYPNGRLGKKDRQTEKDTIHLTEQANPHQVYTHTYTHTSSAATLGALESLLCWWQSPVCGNEGKGLAGGQRWKERTQKLFTRAQ